MRKGWLPKPLYARMRRMEREVKRLKDAEMMRKTLARTRAEIREKYGPTPEERAEMWLRRLQRGRRSHPISLGSGGSYDLRGPRNPEKSEDSA